MKAALQILEARLKSHRPIMVGHNQFYDLLFLYNTFIDDLPDSSTEFFAKIHELFPTILDTKILAIHDQAIEGEDPLADIFDRTTDSNAKPHEWWDSAYGYGRRASAHEAGFDSFMTAAVLLRLGHKLAAAQGDLDEDHREPESQKRRMGRLYSKGWLCDIGRDPDCFDTSGSELDFGEAEESYGGESVLPSLEWSGFVIDKFRNILRIGPSITIHLERQRS